MNPDKLAAAAARLARGESPTNVAEALDLSHATLYRHADVKMDKEMTSADVLGKREAAKRWANYVSADASVGTPWRYLLVSESDVAEAKGSWPALKKLGQ